MKIGLIGQMRAGKTTAMDFIRQFLSDNYKNFINLRLSDPIYDEAKRLYNKYDVPFVKNRRLLEGLGEIFNSVPGDYLVFKFMKRLNDIENVENQLIICDDIRTRFQAGALKNRGFILIKIVAVEDVRSYRAKDGEFAIGHYSDTELINYCVDYEIDNNTTKEEFFRKLENTINLIGGNNG